MKTGLHLNWEMRPCFSITGSLHSNIMGSYTLAVMINEGLLMIGNAPVAQVDRAMDS